MGVNARSALLAGRACTLTGRGAEVLLLDSGIDEGGIGARRFGRRLTFLGRGSRETGVARDEQHHAFRGATLCAEGEEARSLPGGPVGVAPAAHIVSVDYQPLFPEKLLTLWETLRRQKRKVDVVGHAYSSPDEPALRPMRRAEIDRFAETDARGSVTTFAAAGHGGATGVRFPASCEGVIAVGISGPDGRSVEYSGRTRDGLKPEILVPDHRYLARMPDGELDSLNGTSAAVAIAVGVAALWCERVRELGLEPTPSLLRALVLGTGDSVPGQRSRILGVPSSLIERAPVAHTTFEPSTSLERVLEVRVRESGRLHVAIALRRSSSLGLWEQGTSTCTISVGTPGRVARDDGCGWAGIALDVQAGDLLSVRTSVTGRVEDATLVAIGGGVESFHDLPAVSARVRSLHAAGPVVVGVSASHDGSACIMRGGKLEHAIQLERITRIKRDGRPYLDSRAAIDYCLEASGLRTRDVDLFAFNCQPLLPGYVGLSQPVAERGFDAFDPLGDRSLFVSHHLAHAFSAFYGSPFDSAAVLVADGSGGSTIGGDDLLLRGPELGEYIAGSVARRPGVHVQSLYRFTRQGYQLIDRELADSFNVRCGSTSLGEVYAAVSQYLFGDWREGGKLMGLAPYGDPEEAGESFLIRDDSGRLQFRGEWKTRYPLAGEEIDPMTDRHLAARVQRDLVTALVDRARRIPSLSGESKVAYSGGLALNSVANEAIRSTAGISDLYVLPASSDAGISIGAAAAGHYILTGELCSGHLRTDCFGYAYTRDDCQSAIASFGGQVRTTPMSIGDIAGRLVAGQVVGWFEGGAEFGPRALGHRSILADPRSEKMWRHINRRIKFREDFRPFAPVVPVEDASRFFEIDTPSPFMLRVVPVRHEHRRALGAVTHVDGTARVQTVERGLHPRWHALLREVGRLNGVPILINTSLNVRGQPVVETPAQAIEILLATHMDALVLGDVVVERHSSGDRGSWLRARLTLAPKVHLRWELREGRESAILRAGLRGDATINVARWTVDMLEHFDGSATLQDVLESHRTPPDISVQDVIRVVAALWDLRLLVIVGGEAG